MGNAGNDDSVMERINGIDFTVYRFHAKDAFGLQFYLARIIGPMIGNLIGAIGEVLAGKTKIEMSYDGMAQIGNLKLDGHELSVAIGELLGRLGSEEEYLSFIQRMLNKTVAYKDGKPHGFTKDHFNASLDIVFGGRTFSIIPVIALVMRANFPDFLSEIKALIGSRIQPISTSKAAESSLKSESENSETSED